MVPFCGRRRGRCRRAAMGRSHEAASRHASWWRTRAAAAARSRPAKSRARNRTAIRRCSATPASWCSTRPSWPKVPYDPVKDFAPISILAISVNGIMIHPSVPAKHAEGIRRLRQGQCQQAVLWLGRRRHHDAACRRTVQADHRRAGDHPCALSRRRPQHRRSGQSGQHPDGDHQRDRPDRSNCIAPARSASSPSPRRNA